VYRGHNRRAAIRAQPLPAGRKARWLPALLADVSLLGLLDVVRSADAARVELCRLLACTLHAEDLSTLGAEFLRQVDVAEWAKIGMRGVVSRLRHAKNRRKDRTNSFRRLRESGANRLRSGVLNRL